MSGSYGRKIFKRRVFRLVDNPICYICENTLNYDTATVDHYIPVYMGGKDKLKNYELACKDCNNKKGHTLNYFYKQQRKKNRVPDSVRYGA